jgi:hypothetical protein
MNWQETIKRSKYHFDSFKFDKEVDKINKFGCIKGSSTDQLDKLTQLFALENSTQTIKTLTPGQTTTLSLDDLNDVAPDNPWRIVKIVVHLTDWEPGHFCNYGNYMHYQWKKGDAYSFDWQNIPYSIANAGNNSLVTYELIGVLTERSDEFIKRLKRFDTYTL